MRTLRGAAAIAVVACALLGGCRGAKNEAPEAEGAIAQAEKLPADRDFAFTAGVGGGGLPGGWGATIESFPGGKTEVSFEYGLHGDDSDARMIKRTQELELTESDIELVRRCVEDSGFFEDRPHERGCSILVMSTWELTVRSAGRTGKQTFFDREAQELRRLVQRVIHQAVAQYALDSKNDELLDDLLGRGEEVLHGEPFVASLRQRATSGTTPVDSARAVQSLRNLLAHAEFSALLRETLDGADAAKRDAIVAILVAWHPSPSQADAVVPLALETLEASWREWNSGDRLRAKLLEDCAYFLARVRAPEALPLFERMVVELSTPERPLVLQPLAAMGDLAVESLVRLLDHPRLEVRVASAWTCEGIGGSLRKGTLSVRYPGVDPFVTLPALRNGLGPRLERAADDEAGSPLLRQAAGDALAALGMRPAPAGWKPRTLDRL